MSIVQHTIHDETEKNIVYAQFLLLYIVNIYWEIIMIKIMRIQARAARLDSTNLSYNLSVAIV